MKSHGCFHAEMVKSLVSKRCACTSSEREHGSNSDTYASLHMECLGSNSNPRVPAAVRLCLGDYVWDDRIHSLMATPSRTTFVKNSTYSTLTLGTELRTQRNVQNVSKYVSRYSRIKRGEVLNVNYAGNPPPPPIVLM